MKVDLVDYMGDDLRVVNAARVSFDKASTWYKEPDDEYGYGRPELELREKDQKLIAYLANHNHWTPFSHVVITMRETVPIFVARQRFKHVVGFTYNEVSRRYVDDTPEFYIPDVWRKASENKKQGSSDESVDGAYSELNGGYTPHERYKTLLERVKNAYEDFIDAGMAPEQARIILPQSMYTSYYVTGSLAAWARAYKLRIEEHAQKEIRDLAKMWNDTICNIEGLKYSWAALST